MGRIGHMDAPEHLCDVPMAPLAEDCRDLTCLADYLTSAQSNIKTMALRGADGLALAGRYSDYVDVAVARMFEMATASECQAGQDRVAPIAIVATGGYGRREMCLHSDIDITFIPQRDGDPAIDPVVKSMFASLMRVLMDSAKIDVGYAYRLIEDCGNLDHQTMCGLLDARLIAGSPRVFLQFEHEFWPKVNPAEFIFTKLDERRAQRLASGGTPRTVEPNLKTGPGGLRDLQAAIWLIQARESLPAATVRGERSWDVLTKRAGIAPEEVRALRAAKEFLFRTRNALHAVVGQERDHLVVTRQEAISDCLGYTDDDGGAPAVERFMRDTYRHLTTIDRLCDEIAQRVENSRLFMGIGLDCVQRQLTPANPLLATEDPVWTVHAAEMAQRYGLDFSPELRHAVIALLAGQPRTRENARLAEVFTTILSSRRPVYPILQTMADLGILGWMLPDVGRIMDLIPYDASHDYTVGQHSLYVVRNLDDLRAGSVGEDMRELQMMMAELAAPEQLYLAALLHDAGKAAPGQPHWESGRVLAENACALLGWKPEATANVVFLVHHHLLMAETSRLRDLGLDETIREFTAIVDDPERLRMLYLLTYADTRAVGQGLWTQVKAKYLHDLYRRAERALSAGAEDGADDALLSRTRRRLAKELAVDDLPAEEVDAHLERLPAQYVLNTTMEEIALHIGFVREARLGRPAVSFHDDRFATFTEVTVCTLDDPTPGLLAKIAGVLYAAGVTVHAAQVFTRIEGDERIAIDTLCVDFRGRQLTSGKRREITTNLVGVLTGETTVEGVLEKLSVHNDRSARYTIIEVASPEPQSTLYRVARALSALGWDIHSARLAMFRGRSMATFYVGGAKGLSDAAALGALGSLLPMGAAASNR
ncbi:MAG: HD domain-containing protein [Armatimonadetes bacterium]|nr:HD domain-containing protein [Armatimonadota bacterium]